MEEENREYYRYETSFPIHFNLNPDHHYVPAIRKMGVAGTIRNISLQGLGIDSQMDLLDLCQIFSEAIEDGSPFELEIQFWDSSGRRVLLKGSVRWHQVSEPKNDIRHFKAGLLLKDAETLTAARGLVESIAGIGLA
jgi:hypothetical protein